MAQTNFRAQDMPGATKPAPEKTPQAAKPAAAKKKTEPKK